MPRYNGRYQCDPCGAVLDIPRFAEPHTLIALAGDETTRRILTLAGK
jgi:hypothetical protein